jgi:hypothetical protein
MMSRLELEDPRGRRRLSREQFTRLFFRQIKVLHPLRWHRFGAGTRGWSPVR